MKKIRLFVFLSAIMVLASLVLAACGGSAATVVPTNPPAAGGQAPAGDPAAGQTAFAGLPCQGCHGPDAQGKNGPKLAGYSKGWGAFSNHVRNGGQIMPPFGPDKVSDQTMADIYAWLITLK